ncbi:hypothetical protein FACS18949_15180 [Clostridia bacterium]|nr:hypothetical protein FACS18949_15180 [Clostridia bacterium]
MIIYQIYHGGAWEWVLTHAVTVAAKKEKILLVSNDNEKSFGAVNGLDAFVDAGVFSRVVRFPGYVGHKQKSIEHMERLIVEKYDAFFCENAIDILSAEAIYSSSDMIHSFGVYLAIKKIPYYFYEMFANHFTLRSTMKGRNLYEKLLEKYGAYNANYNLITPVLLGDSSNPFPIDKAIQKL